LGSDPGLKDPAFHGLATTAAKAVLFSLDGRLQSVGHAEYPVQHVRSNWVEQNPSQFPESNILIRGYTDAKGPADANLVLSQKRAAAVKRWLVKKGAVTETKIATEGLGEKDPVAENKNADGSDNPEGRQQNRRVEITVEKPPTAK
jgi:hypothetical protein